MYTCPHCGAVSHNPNDLAHRYCGRCHRYADEQALAEAMLAGVIEQSRRAFAIDNAEKALGLTQDEATDAIDPPWYMRKIWPPSK